MSRETLSGQLKKEGVMFRSLRDLLKTDDEDDDGAKIVFSRTSRVKLDDMGFIKDPKIDSEIIRQITCGCESHEYGACVNIFKAGMKTPKAITDVYLRYADMNHKMHKAYLEQGNRKVWQLAEDILIFEDKNK